MAIVDDLFKRREELIKKIEKINHFLANSLPGYLICRKKKNTFRYYHMVNQNQGSPRFGKEVYLSKNDPHLLDLAKRDYYKQYLQDLQQELHSIQGYLNSHKKESHVDSYLNKHPGIREILQPALINKKNRFANWATQPYERNTAHPETLIYITDGGFYVRSKAEQMIANMYLAEGIPFRYEDPVTTPSGYTIHPDFHLYSLRDYSELYHEHNGMMLDEKYFASYEKKLRDLRSANIVPGVNLLQTFEAVGHPLKPESVRHLIRTYLR